MRSSSVRPVPPAICSRSSFSEPSSFEYSRLCACVRACVSERVYASVRTRLVYRTVAIERMRAILSATRIIAYAAGQQRVLGESPCVAFPHQLPCPLLHRIEQPSHFVALYELLFVAFPLQPGTIHVALVLILEHRAHRALVLLEILVELSRLLDARHCREGTSASRALAPPSSRRPATSNTRCLSNARMVSTPAMTPATTPTTTTTETTSEARPPTPSKLREARGGRRAGTENEVQ